MHEDRKLRLSDFVSWVHAHLSGDEKGEAQIFLDRLFQAFELKGVKEAGAVLEMRVKKRDEGGTAFADLVYKPIVLIEMKKRGADLRRHYRQAFDYWVNLAPNRPKYVVLCNFDEFWVYDFDSAQYDEPLDKVPLDELPQKWGPLRFLYPTHERPTFGNDHEEVTRNAADLLATCFNKLAARQDIGRATAQRFILQMLVALFAEDIGLLDKYFVTELLEDCKSPADSYDLLGGLFVAMNTPGKAQGGRFKGVDYFNGGLFAEPARLELHADELNQLRAAAKSNWSKVRPEIFGTLFEHSLGHEERHAFGAHFTSPVDIMKIVGPTVVQPWREQIESAKTRARLFELRSRLAHFTVLDPACGSGNFLYLAYREIKRLEADINRRLAEEFKSEADTDQKRLGFVTAQQFFGLDINPFAIELAKVTMMVARKLAIDELHITEPALPLDNLDKNFVVCDALIDDHGLPRQWPKTDVIIGNPPFLGAKRLKPERGPDYVNAVRRAYPDVPGMADYCVYWLRKANDLLAECTADDPVAGRAGLVGTQNIRNNQSRVGGLDHIVETGTIVEAVENQPWSGEANVHVSIVNWAKTHDAVLTPERRLWTKIEPPKGEKRRFTDCQRADKTYELVMRECDGINASLSDAATVSEAFPLECNTSPQVSFQGVVPGYDGFAVDEKDAAKLVEQSEECEKVIKPWMIGRDVLTGDGQPTRLILDFADSEMSEAQAIGPAFTLLSKRVLPAIRKTAESSKDNMKAAREEHLGRWWQFWNVRTEMREAFRSKARYIACSRVTKRPIFVFASTEITPDGALQVWALDDDYSFGVIQSDAHWQWFLANCSKLKSDFRYTRRSVWDTFPWPQFPDAGKVEEVAKAAIRVRQARDAALRTMHGGLRGLYRVLELPGKHPLKEAHLELNAAVNEAYGFKENRPILDDLLDLNHALAARQNAGQPVTSPGIPKEFNHPRSLITDDCILPPINGRPKRKTT